MQRLGLTVRAGGCRAGDHSAGDDLAALWRHEMRWARTIRALVPVQFAASVLQYPLAWAALTIVLAGGALWPLSWFAARLG